MVIKHYKKPQNQYLFSIYVARKQDEEATKLWHKPTDLWHFYIWF